MKCAVFASGGGSNFGALITKKQEGELHAELTVCIVNNSRAGAAERARNEGIPVVHLAPSHFGSEEEYTNDLKKCLADYGIELIILAGYMKKLPAMVVHEFANRIVNIHPALLPAFGGKGMYGAHVHEAVIKSGVKISGITVHFVDDEYDQGPIIFQDVVKVLDTDTPDTLAARVLTLEHASYWRVVEALSSGKITVQDRRVSGDI